MGTFDNPFDADRRLRNGGCPCGGHANRSEHDRASPDRPECSAIDGEEAGYETVVAAAAMRAIFPKDAVRRAFLKSVGASTALAALAQFFPLATATEVFAQGAGAPDAGKPAAEGEKPDEDDKDPYEGINPEELPPDLQYDADASVSFPTNT